VRKNDNIVANIPKDEDDVPLNIWAHTMEPNSQEFVMLISFQNGKLAAYKVNEQKKQFSAYWEIKVSKWVKIEAGVRLEAKEVFLKEEERMIEGAEEGERTEREAKEVEEKQDEMTGKEGRNETVASDIREKPKQK
jgi:hypothetical protein